MQITSKRISLPGCLLFSIATLIVSPAGAIDLLLSPSQSGRIILDVKKHHVTAKDSEKNINYEIAAAVSQHLTRADDIQLVGNASNTKVQLFILMTRERSRPKAMGRGYCGAGYEDYLLLVEVLEKKLLLRDQLLLQSCLKSISMFIDQGDDHPRNGLINQKDGSLSYRLVDDDADKKRTLTINDKHFKTKLIQYPDQ